MIQTLITNNKNTFGYKYFYMNAEQILDARKNAQVYADLQGKEYVDPHPDFDEAGIKIQAAPPANNSNTVIPIVDEELSTDKLLEMLAKKGIKVNSLEDLQPKQTPEEIEAAEQKRKSDMLAYGLSTGKFKKEEYDFYQQATANKIAIITSDLTEKIKAAHPELTEEQVEEKVANYTMAHLPADDVLRVQREQELIELADSRLQKKFKNIYSLESDFDQHLQGINNKTNLENKVKAALPVYQRDVDSVLGQFKKIVVPVNDTKNPANNIDVELEFSDTDLNELRDALLTPDNIVRQVKNGYTVEQLQKEAQAVLLTQHWERLISQAAKSYNSKQKDLYLRGRKGLMPDAHTLDISDDNLAGGLQDIYDQLKDSAPAN